MVEIIYSLYLLSGISKPFLKFFFGNYWGEQFNITLALAILLVLLSFSDWFKNAFFKNRFYVTHGAGRSIITIILFYLWMIFSLAYTISPAYSYMKTFLFLTIMVAFIFPLTRKTFDGKRFMRSFVLMGSLFILTYLTMLPKSYAEFAEKMEMFSGKYLDLAFLAALNLLIIMLLELDWKRLVKVVLIGANISAILIAGARGPMLFLILVLLMRLFLNPKIILRQFAHFDLKKILALTLSMVILAVGLIYAIDRYADNMERSIERLKLVTDVESSSLSVRVTQLAFSAGVIFDNPGNSMIGKGIGSFGILYEGSDERLYPHNIIVETWFELGIIGVILLLSFFLFYLKRIKWNTGYFYIFLYLLFNSLKSSSLVDLRIMFGILACLLVFANYMKNRRKQAITETGKNAHED
ncbi:MAG: O-antigen ligase family protein [bacterium]|nr:O-antigen ligase family protein [bacterium]